MKFGLFVGAKIGAHTLEASMAGDSLSLRDFLSYVQTAEDEGFENLFVVEHHFTGAGQISASLNLLSYLAARTRTLRLGTAVVVLPWHNPALLAEQVATLDLLCDGRFDFGIGKGYRPDEFKGFCMPMGEAQGRFEEAVQFLKTAWTSQGRFSFNGQWHRYENIVVEPQPVQQPHPPFWMAAGSNASAENAARSDFSMLLDQVIPARTVGERIEVYQQEQRRCGFQPRAEKICLARGFRIVATEAEARQVRRETGEWLERVGALKALGAADGSARDRIDQYVRSRIPLIGTVDYIVSLIHELAEAGVGHIILNDRSGSGEALRIFAREVMPHFADEKKNRFV